MKGRADSALPPSLVWVITESSLCSGLVWGKLLSVMLHKQEGVLTLQHVQKIGAQADWAELSDELWCSIFSCIRAPECGHDSHGCIGDDQESLINFYNIPSVCQKFKGVFADNPGLFTTLLVGDQTTRQGWPGMLKWIHRHGPAVKTLSARGGSLWSEAALTALQSSYVAHNMQACLLFACLTCTTDTSIALLGCVSSITQINLDGAALVDARLDLTPLQELPHLTSLQLENSDFDGLDSLQHLTRFRARDCDVQCRTNCAFVTSLVELRVTCSTFENFHTSGLAACVKLQQLQCYEANIKAVNHAEATIIRGAFFIVPYSISALTALTSLDISCSYNSKRVHLDWLGQLQTLKSIILELNVEDMKLPQSVGELTQLTEMRLDTVSGGRIIVAFDWSRLVALQVLTIAGRVQFDKGVMDMTELMSLTRVTFCDIKYCDVDTVRKIGLLTDKLSATRPDVQVCLI